MADCNVTIVFSKRGATVVPGEELQGEVVVKVDAPCRCDGLTLAAEWRTSGKGNPTTGQGEVKSLFTGQWEVGEHRYRFVYKAPVGPFTHDGTLLDLNWFLHARADIPWAIDPKADAPFRLGPGPNSETDAYFFGPLYKPPAPGTRGVSETAQGGSAVKKPMGLGAKVAIGLLLTVVIGSMAMAIPVLAAILAPFALFFFVKKVMIKSKLGEPEVKILPNPARPGEEVMVVARLNPLKEVKFGKVFAELVGEERVVHGSGKHAVTHRNNLCTLAHDFPMHQREARGGEHLELRVNLKVPVGAPLTFVASSNTIEWRLKVSIELLGWPDWAQTFPITVRPAATSGALPAATFAPH